MKKLVIILFIIMTFITFIQIRNTFALYKTRLTAEYENLLGIWSVKVNETDLSSGSADMTFDIELTFEDAENLIFEDNIGPGSIAYFDLLLDPIGTDVSIGYTIEINQNAKFKIGEDTYEVAGKLPITVLELEETFIKVENDGSETIDEDIEPINYIDIASQKISGVIPIDVIEQNYKDKIRVRLEWTDKGNDLFEVLENNLTTNRDRIVNEAIDSYNKFDTMLGNAELANTFGFTTGNNTVDEALLTGTRPTIILPVNLELVQYMGEPLTP